MKISSDHVGRIMGAQLRGKDRAGKSQGPGAQLDRVSLSRRAEYLKAAQQALKSSSDVDLDKVEQIRRQIQEGAYEIDSEQLAEDLLRESILQKRPR